MTQLLHLFCAIFVLAFIPTLHADDSSPKNLTEALEQKKAASNARKKPASVTKTMKDAIEELRSSNFIENVIKVGDRLPNASLLDPHGKVVELAEIIDGQPAIVTFYRGGWCPYCNIQLHYYQLSLAKFKELGATLVAISPELPDNSLSTTQKNDLEFAVLSDKDNHYAKKLGLVFPLPKDLLDVYRSFGIDLTQSQGNSHGELPLSATFVVNSKGNITYRFVDVDYTNRASEDDLLNALKALE